MRERYRATVAGGNVVASGQLHTILPGVLDLVRRGYVVWLRRPADIFVGCAALRRGADGGTTLSWQSETGPDIAPPWVAHVQNFIDNSQEDTA